jgi:hypothetical protein
MGAGSMWEDILGMKAIMCWSRRSRRREGENGEKGRKGRRA